MNFARHTMPICRYTPIVARGANAAEALQDQRSEPARRRLLLRDAGCEHDYYAFGYHEHLPE